MWQATDARAAAGGRMLQYHGKWPFVRVLGVQEPVSAFFSAVTGAVENTACMAWMPARTKRLIGRGWPKPRAAEVLSGADRMPRCEPTGPDLSERVQPSASRLLPRQSMPQAAPSLGQPAALAALAGHTPLIFDIGERRCARCWPAALLAAHGSRGRRARLALARPRPRRGASLVLGVGVPLPRCLLAAGLLAATLSASCNP
jgi:hypothetical protein